MSITIKSFWPAILWLIFSTIAFCLPGSVLPAKTWFELIQPDKWIHIGLFLMMVFLWSMPLLNKQSFKFSYRKLFMVSMVFFGYGILMEFVQHFFVSNRAFDLGDIVADAVGCAIGFLLVKTQWKK